MRTNAIASVWWMICSIIQSTTTLSIKEILHLEPGVRLLAENLTVTVPQKMSINGEEKVENWVLSAGKLDVEYEKDNLRDYSELYSHESLESSINRSIDPCQDFYSFVCDGWQKKNPIDNHQYMNTQTESLTKTVLFQFKKLFETPSLFHLSRERRMMYDFYLKCTDNRERNQIRSKPFFQIMRKIRQANLQYVTDWMLFIQPITAFFDVVIGADEYNSSVNTLEIWPQSSFLSDEYYNEDVYRNQLSATHEFLKEVVRLLSEDDTNKEFFSGHQWEMERRLQNFLKTDSGMAMILSYTDDNNSDITVNLRELDELILSINLSRYIHDVVPPEIKRRINLDKMTIRVRNLPAIRLVDQLLHRIDNQTLADYLDWKIIIAHLPYMDDRFKKLFEEFNRKVYGVQPTEADNWERCIQSTTETFEDVASALYIEKYFNQSTVTEIHSIVTSLKNSFLELLENNSWMDDKTKTKARIKANAISEFIGFNPVIFDQTLTTKRYKELSFDSSWRMYDISREMSRWSFRQSFFKLVHRNTEASFEFLASEVNAFYEPSQNQIAILAGMLQSPFFNSTLPRSLNYGAIGVVIGHEITHGFDNYGALFDEQGNRNNWWDTETMRNFDTFKECFVEQYGNITIHNINMTVDGKRTEGENIADNGGMRAALRAVSKIIREPEEKMKKVKGLEDFSLLQLFFMNYAFTWCGNWRVETLLTELASDNHSPDFTRVNVVLSNQPQFAEAFKCPANSPMIAKKRCILW